MERVAEQEDGALGAPSVGTWVPAIGLGRPLEAGMVIGWLVRDGKRLAVTAPRRVSGVAVDVLPRGRWVAYGDPLVREGEGGLASAAVAHAARVVGGPDGAVAVRAETDGTVWLRPEPGAAAFVAEGDAVAAHATLALVEVMKTFTPVRSPVAGRVARVDVEDGEGVAEGAVLVWVSP